MRSDLINLITCFNFNPDIKLLVSKMHQSSDDFWLVGGCLRNSLLDLPPVDIDIASSGDPTVLARSWGSEVSGSWFWLDADRQQSRVLLPSGLTFDFAPLRAPSISEDLRLRDFTINALALPVDNGFPDSELLDPLCGVNHLGKKQLYCCSSQSFNDDPLRMLKGVRHAVTLGFELSESTLKYIVSSKHLLVNTAGERIRDELSKVFNSEKVINGIELLIDTGLLTVLFGAAGDNWDRNAAIAQISLLVGELRELDLNTIAKLSALQNKDTFSLCALFLFSQLIKNYTPEDVPKLLHNQLRLSRLEKKLITELQVEPDMEILFWLRTTAGQRRQALLAEMMGSFFFEKVLYWSICGRSVVLDRAFELQRSFIQEQNHGRVPALLNGRQILSILGNHQAAHVGKWQDRIKVTEIKGEITTSLQAEKWLKSKLSFDKKEG